MKDGEVLVSKAGGGERGLEKQLKVNKQRVAIIRGKVGAGGGG